LKKCSLLLLGALVIALTLAVSPGILAQDVFFTVSFRFPFATCLLDAMCERRLPAGSLTRDGKMAAPVLSAGQTNDLRTFRFQLQDSLRNTTELVFISKDPFLALALLDVNRDGAPDLVVEQSLTHRLLRVWLNDGDGNFREASADQFRHRGYEPPHSVGVLPRGQDYPARRMRVKRGTKLIVERALSPSTHDFSTHRYALLLGPPDQRERKGPNPPRAPPLFFV
jgi:hypothetical protein